VEEWLRYAPQESLSLYMFQKPRTAKKLHFDVIPKAVDEYRQHVNAFDGQSADKQLENPTWHIHSGQPPKLGADISFSLMLNLVAVANAEDKDTLWGFIARYAPNATPKNEPFLDRLAGYALAYYEDFVKPTKVFREPDATERAAMEDLVQRLKALDPTETDAEVIQTEVFAAGKAHEFENLRDWFKALYEVLLGQSQGPRFGGLAALYGLPQTIELIETALARD
jgi:lysyl-tRNA synthetase class 1